MKKGKLNFFDYINLLLEFVSESYKGRKPNDVESTILVNFCFHKYIITDNSKMKYFEDYLKGIY